MAGDNSRSGKNVLSVKAPDIPPHQETEAEASNHAGQGTDMHIAGSVAQQRANQGQYNRGGIQKKGVSLPSKCLEERHRVKYCQARCGYLIREVIP